MSPFGICGRGHPESRGSSPAKGGSGPGPPGSSDHSVVREMGLRGHHKDTGEHAASAPAPPSALFVLRLLSFSFRETVAQWFLFSLPKQLCLAASL